MLKSSKDFILSGDLRLSTLFLVLVRNNPTSASICSSPSIKLALVFLLVLWFRIKWTMSLKRFAMWFEFVFISRECVVVLAVGVNCENYYVIVFTLEREYI